MELGATAWGDGFFLVVLGFEFRALCLLSRQFYNLSHDAVQGELYLSRAEAEGSLIPKLPPCLPPGICGGCSCERRDFVSPLPSPGHLALCGRHTGCGVKRTSISCT
jgi:hypothetical protein